MIQVLKTLKNEFKRLNIPYYYDDWTNKLQLPYFVGELSEVPTNDEDGKREFSFTLTGEDVKTYSNLLRYGDDLHFDYKNNGKTILTENGAVVIMWDSMITVPVEAQSVKRVQINLTIYLWEDK